MKKRSKFLKVFWIFLLILLLCFCSFISVRQLSEREIDDVHPNIACNEEYLQKSDIIFVIPLFNNDSIANSPKWCNKIRALNKTIGMHGVYHTYNEFFILRDKSYLQKGITEFENCFGFKPEIFKAPQWKLSTKNNQILEGFQIRGPFDSVIHKTYHCSDSEGFSYKLLGIKITNQLIDWI